MPGRVAGSRLQCSRTDLMQYKHRDKYPEWPHRHCVGLAYPQMSVRAPVAAASLAICRPRLHRAIRGAQGVLPMRVGGATRQLDQPSLTPLSVADCG